MLNNFTETGSLEFLAGFDFLDVCLLGETGTGKTRMAQLIHDLSPRKDKPFVAINCAELAPALIESGLFGYEKGAFTGATEPKKGKFEAAEGGTIFLDEIGELALEVQAKLLKVIEEKRVMRVGSSVLRPVDVRIVYATHRDLSVLRKDLRYRIRAAQAIRLKPLRERRSEILPLAQAFIADFSRKSMRVVTASEETLRPLERAEWRGNVRELRSFVEKACFGALFDCKGQKTTEKKLTVELTAELIFSQLRNFESIDAGDGFQDSENSALPTLASNTRLSMRGSDEYKRAVKEFDRSLIKKTLEENKQNVSRTASELGLSRYGLIKKIRRYGIKVVD